MRSTDLPVQGGELAKQWLGLGALLVLVAALGYFIVHGGNFARTAPPTSHLVDLTAASRPLLALCGTPTADGHPVPVEMLYSEDMRTWIEFAADRFVRKCPSIQVKLVPMQDLAAVDGLLSGTLRPTIWAPTDELALRYLDYRGNHQAAPLPFKPTDKFDLVASPLVLLIWEDRRRVLAKVLSEQQSPEGQWARSLCPLVPRVPDLTGVPLEAMVPGGWSDLYQLLAPTVPRGAARKRGPPPRGMLPSLAEVQTWGTIKIGWARPTRYASGAAALYLLAHDYIRQLDQQSAATFEQSLTEQRTALTSWLRRCQAGLEAPLRSEQELTSDLFNQGPSYLDAVVTYEHLVLPLLAKIDDSAGNLEKIAIVYPEPTIVSRHPAAVFQTSPAQRDAALRWLQFLRSRPMQQKAIELGFRGVSHNTAVDDFQVAANPFFRLRRYGVLPEPHLIEPPEPSGRVVAQLLSIWGDATGRN